MANTVIQIKKSATPSAAPTDLANGELAINFADGIIYYKHANLSIASLSSGGPSFGTVDVDGTLVVADTNGDILTLLGGPDITLVADPTSDTIRVFANNISRAFDKANTANSDAIAAFLTANVAWVHANAAFLTANQSFAHANAGFLTANQAFAKANAALANTSGVTFDGVLNISNNVTTQGLNVISHVISFGTAMSILPNGMIMIYGDLNMLT